MGLQVDEEYFAVVAVREHYFLEAEHFDRNFVIRFGCHYFPEKLLSVRIGVEENHLTHLNIREIEILCQEYKSVVEGSEGIPNLFVLFLEADRNSLLHQH